MVFFALALALALAGKYALDMKLLILTILSFTSVGIPLPDNCDCIAADPTLSPQVSNNVEGIQFTVSAPRISPVKYTDGFCAWPGCASAGDETDCQWRFHVELDVISSETNAGKYWQVRGLKTGGTEIFETVVYQMSTTILTVGAVNQLRTAVCGGSDPYPVVIEVRVGDTWTDLSDYQRIGTANVIFPCVQCETILPK